MPDPVNWPTVGLGSGGRKLAEATVDIYIFYNGPRPCGVISLPAAFSWTLKRTFESLSPGKKGVSLSAIESGCGRSPSKALKVKHRPSLTGGFCVFWPPSCLGGEGQASFIWCTRLNTYSLQEEKDNYNLSICMHATKKIPIPCTKFFFILKLRICVQRQRSLPCCP